MHSYDVLLIFGVSLGPDHILVNEVHYFTLSLCGEVVELVEDIDHVLD